MNPRRLSQQSDSLKMKDLQRAKQLQDIEEARQRGQQQKADKLMK